MPRGSETFGKGGPISNRMRLIENTESAKPSYELNSRNVHKLNDS